MDSNSQKSSSRIFHFTDKQGGPFPGWVRPTGDEGRAGP
jgi:hypothetical protein